MIGADTTFLVQLEIREMPEHDRAHVLLKREVLDANVQLVLAPQVLAEFVHVVTDARRFQQPLDMVTALTKALFWWNAREVTHAYPSAESTSLFIEWMLRHELGRKRILDTQLAATLWTAGVRRIVTSNVTDFRKFPEFEVLSP